MLITSTLSNKILALLNPECNGQQRETDQSSAWRDCRDLVSQLGISQPDPSQLCANVQRFGREDQGSENTAGSVFRRNCSPDIAEHGPVLQ